MFLETSARVGGAFIVDTIEAGTDINLWREWAKIEIAGENDERFPQAEDAKRVREAGLAASVIADVDATHQPSGNKPDGNGAEEVAGDSSDENIH